MDTTARVDTWRRLLNNPGKSWVLYEHGTCVILTAPEGDLAEQATELLSEYGPVHAGSEAGDFNVLDVGDDDGWVVAGHHPDVLVHVSPTEVGEGGGMEDIAVGLFGRSKRNRDGTELGVVHVEDNRRTAASA